LPDASPASPLAETLFSARVTQWTYPRDITQAQAQDYATSLAARGVNMVLTEGHRSLVNDWPSKAEDIAIIAREGGADASVTATKVIAQACHARGIRVLHHVTSTFCTKAYLDAHPDWAQRDARTGEPLYFSLYGGLWLLCPNNPQWREHYFGLVADFTRRTGVDGWMVDEVEYLPDWFSCGCRHCREKFRRETGFTLPEGRDSAVWGDFGSPVWRAWLRFRMKSGGDFFADLKERLDAAAPGQVLTGCVAGASETFLTQYWGMDASELARAGNFPFYEAYFDKGSPWFSWRRVMAEMRLYSAIARPHGTPALTLFYPTSREEALPCWAMCNAAGNRLWALNQGQPGYDPAQASIGDAGFFVWETKQGHLFAPQDEVADIALLFSKASRDAEPTSGGTTHAEFATTPRSRLGGRARAAGAGEWAGWAETLTAANAPFRVVRDGDLTDEGLSGFRVLVLPNASCMGDAQARAVTAFARRGGRVITSGENAARDETGAPRADNAPADAIRKAATHLDGYPGARALMGLQYAGKPCEDPCDPAAVSAMMKAVRDALPDPAWEVEAPEGVCAGVFRQRSTGAVVVHLANLVAARADAGTTLPAPGELKPAFPPQQDIRVRLNAALAPEDAAAVWHPYDGEPVPVPIHRMRGRAEVTVPRLTVCGVLDVRRR
jgi:hypothetical protein